MEESFFLCSKGDRGNSLEALAQNFSKDFHTWVNVLGKEKKKKTKLFREKKFIMPACNSAITVCQRDFVTFSLLLCHKSRVLSLSQTVLQHCLWIRRLTFITVNLLSHFIYNELTD